MAQWLITAVHYIIVTSNIAAIPGGRVNANSAMVTIGMVKVVFKAKWSCSVWGLSKSIAERQKKKKKKKTILKFQANRTYSFWNVAVERFYVFYCFCQYTDKVNGDMLISIHFCQNFTNILRINLHTTFILQNFGLKLITATLEHSQSHRHAFKGGGTVVWNDYLLIFSQKCHILFHKKVGNSLQIIKYINLSRFQHILKL